MQSTLHAVEGQESERALPGGTGTVVGGFRVALEEAVQHDLVAILVGVGEVQNEGGVGVETANVGAVSAAGKYPETRRHIPVETRNVNIACE